MDGYLREAEARLEDFVTTITMPEPREEISPEKQVETEPSPPKTHDPKVWREETQSVFLSIIVKKFEQFFSNDVSENLLLTSIFC
jgi:hypothetical protein